MIKKSKRCIYIRGEGVGEGEDDGKGEGVMNGCTGVDDDDDVWIWIEKSTVSPTLIENKDVGTWNCRKLK